VRTTGAAWTAWTATRTKTSSEQRLEEWRKGRRAAGTTAGAAAKHGTEEGRRGRSLVVGTAGPGAVATVLASAIGTVSAATATAKRSTAAVTARASSLSTSLVIGGDTLGRVVRGGRKLAHRRVGAFCPILVLLVLLSLLPLGHGLGDLLVVDVLGREVIVVGGAMVCLAVRAVPTASPVSSSASGSKAVAAVAVGTVVRAPVVLGVPVVPSSALFEAALPELGIGEGAHVVGWRRGRGRRRGVIDAGTVIVPVEITWPGHDCCSWFGVLMC
jgi:hypothetical protein